MYREFAKLEEFGRLPMKPPCCGCVIDWGNKLAEQILITVNELLTQHGLLLKVGAAVDATLIPAPCSTKNKDKARDPEMHSSKKGSQWYFDAGYQGIEKRPDDKINLNWQIAIGPGKALSKVNAADALIKQAEKIKAVIRAKVGHPTQVIKRQFVKWTPKSEQL